LNEVADILGIDEYISLPVARAYLKRIFPTNWVFDANTLHNFILKCRIFKSYSDTNKPILKPNMNKPGYLELVGLSQQDLIDKSLMLSGQALEDSLKNEDDTWIVKKLMHSLKTSDDGFDYRISTDIKGRPSGVVWVTSTMRFNYEQYVFCLFLDSMKRELNDLKWPYISVVVIDSYQKVRCACEAIVSSERIEAYK